MTFVKNIATFFWIALLILSFWGFFKIFLLQEYIFKPTIGTFPPPSGDRTDDTHDDRSNNISDVEKRGFKMVELSYEDAYNMRISYLMKRFPNYPMKILNNANEVDVLVRNEESDTNKNCSSVKHPTLSKMIIVNKNWQLLTSRSGEGSFYLYSAFIDNRMTELNLTNDIISITGLYTKASEELWCYAWYSSNSKLDQFSRVVVKRAILKEYRSPEAKGLEAGIIQCPVIGNPTVVSVAGSSCVSVHHNALSLSKQNKNKGGFLALCLKQIFAYGEDHSTILVEWFEFQKQLKIEKIIVYVISVHPNIVKVLRHYQEEGFVEVIPLTHPDDVYDFLWYKADQAKKSSKYTRPIQRTAYFNCFFRLMNEFEYVAIYDYDEIPLPTEEHKDLPSMMKTILAKHTGSKFHSFFLRGFLFPTKPVHPNGQIEPIFVNGAEIPLQFVYFSKYTWKKQKPFSGKSILSTKYCEVPLFHAPASVFPGTRIANLGILGHFRVILDGNNNWTSEGLVKDLSLSIIQDRVLPKVIEVDKHLKLPGFNLTGKIPLAKSFRREKNCTVFLSEKELKLNLQDFPEL